MKITTPMDETTLTQINDSSYRGDVVNDTSTTAVPTKTTTEYRYDTYIAQAPLTKMCVDCAHYHTCKYREKLFCLIGEKELDVEEMGLDKNLKDVLDIRLDIQCKFFLKSTPDTYYPSNVPKNDEWEWWKKPWTITDYNKFVNNELKVTMDAIKANVSDSITAYVDPDCIRKE